MSVLRAERCRLAVKPWAWASFILVSSILGVCFGVTEKHIPLVSRKFNFQPGHCNPWCCEYSICWHHIHIWGPLLSEQCPSLEDGKFLTALVLGFNWLTVEYQPVLVVSALFFYLRWDTYVICFIPFFSLGIWKVNFIFAAFLRAKKDQSF